MDVFTQSAKRHPVAFLAAVPITEGMIGEASLVNERLEQLIPANAAASPVYRRHESLNVALNHASISRLALESIPALSPDVQKKALDSLALLFELNFRAWEGLFNVYGEQRTLRLPSPFDPAVLRCDKPAGVA